MDRCDLWTDWKNDLNKLWCLNCFCWWHCAVFFSLFTHTIIKQSASVHHETAFNISTLKHSLIHSILLRKKAGFFGWYLVSLSVVFIFWGASRYNIRGKKNATKTTNGQMMNLLSSQKIAGRVCLCGYIIDGGFVEWSALQPTQWSPHARPFNIHIHTKMIPSLSVCHNNMFSFSGLLPLGKLCWFVSFNELHYKTFELNWNLCKSTICAPRRKSTAKSQA